MILYGKVLIILSIISLLICVLISIYGNLYPKKMIVGNIIVNFGYLFVIINLCILISTVVFVLIANKKLQDNFDFKLKTIEIILVIISILYCIYRMFFFKQTDELLGLGDTTLMVYLSLGIGLDVIIISCIPKLLCILRGCL